MNSRTRCTSPRSTSRWSIALGEVAAERGVPTAQVALAWLLHKPGVTAPIVGATKLEHIEDALAAEQVSLSEGEIERLEEPYVPTPWRVTPRLRRPGRPVWATSAGPAAPDHSVDGQMCRPTPTSSITRRTGSVSCDPTSSSHPSRRARTMAEITARRPLLSMKLSLERSGRRPASVGQRRERLGQVVRRGDVVKPPEQARIASRPPRGVALLDPEMDRSRGRPHHCANGRGLKRLTPRRPLQGPMSLADVGAGTQGQTDDARHPLRAGQSPAINPPPGQRSIRKRASTPAPAGRSRTRRPRGGAHLLPREPPDLVELAVARHRVTATAGPWNPSIREAGNGQAARR